MANAYSISTVSIKKRCTLYSPFRHICTTSFCKEVTDRRFMQRPSLAGHCYPTIVRTALSIFSSGAPLGAPLFVYQPMCSSALPTAIGLLSLSTSMTRMTVWPLPGVISALAADSSVHFAAVMAVP